jgi:hypothetical protein
LRAVELALAVIFALVLLSNPLHANPPEKQPTSLPTLSEEKERLKTLKEAEFRKLKAVVSGDAGYEKKLEALRNIAALATPEAVDLLCTLYDNPLQENSESEQALLVELLGNAGSLAAGPTLLKAVQHPGKEGKVRLAATAAIVRVMDKDAAAAHLKKLSEDKVDAVKNRAWTELLKQQDLNAMRHVFKMLEGKEKLTALAMIKEAHFTEAAKEVAELAKETDFSKGPNEKILKLKALETALDLGHRESVKVAIDLLGAITKDQAEVLQVESPVELLTRYTNENHGSDKKKWQQWLDGKEVAPPLFSRYLDTTSMRDIGNAVIEWTRDKESGPLVKSSVVYLAESSIARAVVKPDDTYRVYTRTEQKLLNVNCIYIGSVFSNGTQAFVILQVHSLESGVALRLQKKDASWEVTGISEGDR